MEKKIRRLEIRLTEKEYELIQKKGANYPTKTSMILEAVRQLGNQNARQKLTDLAEMTALYKQYQQQLSWMGSNLNQAVKRANELPLAGSSLCHTSSKSPSLKFKRWRNCLLKSRSNLMILHAF